MESNRAGLELGGFEKEARDTLLGLPAGFLRGEVS